jgi:uncharacterized NAD(P)/FAD-binding protein YdhS
MAPEVAAQLDRLLADDILTIHSGRLLTAETVDDCARVTVRSTQSGNTFMMAADRVINYTDPSRNYAKTDIPLIAGMREQWRLIPDRLRLGIETDSAGRLIGADGTPVETLFAIGPLRILELFESIAMPEIRVQAAHLAQLLAGGRFSAR